VGQLHKADWAGLAADACVGRMGAGATCEAGQCVAGQKSRPQPELQGDAIPCGCGQGARIETGSFLPSVDTIITGCATGATALRRTAGACTPGVKASAATKSARAM